MSENCRRPWAGSITSRVNMEHASRAMAAAVFYCAATGPASPSALHSSVGLGSVLTTKDGGEIFGFGIDQTGDNGVLASGQDTDKGYRVSVETFDQNTGKIIKSFAKDDGPRNSYSVEGCSRPM